MTQNKLTSNKTSTPEDFYEALFGEPMPEILDPQTAGMIILGLLTIHPVIDEGIFNIFMKTDLTDIFSEIKADTAYVGDIL